MPVCQHKRVSRGLSGKMTTCISQLSFGFLGRRQVIASFDGGEISSDGGLMLVAEADRRLGLTGKLARMIPDHRDPGRVQQPWSLALAQRVYQIAAGYEDCNDADDLRRDPVFKVALGRLPHSGRDLASQPTLSRFENAPSRTQLYRMAEALADTVLNQYAGAEVQRIILDFDATDDPTHGQQQFAEFHGFYDEHCYLPLIVTAQFDGGPHELFTAMLRPGRSHASRGALAVLKRLVAALRERWPEAQLVLRADSGFAIPAIYEWCEESHVGYLISLARNSRLAALAEPHLQAAREEHQSTGEKVRHLHETRYAADSWTHERRVLIKAEVTAKGDNPRYVVTNLDEPDAEGLYSLYAQRGDAENRIKELKDDLAMDRTSCHRFVANQFRVLLHAAAFVLLSFVRKHLHGTELAAAQVGTLQRSLLKLGVRVRESVRRVWLQFASGCPRQELWPVVLARIRGAPA
jgi:hypothetical protein